MRRKTKWKSGHRFLWRNVNVWVLHCILTERWIGSELPTKVRRLRTYSYNEQYITYLSIITGSEGVSFRFPQLFLSQHRLQQYTKTISKLWRGGGKKFKIKKNKLTTPNAFPFFSPLNNTNWPLSWQFLYIHLFMPQPQNVFNLR